jgi:hypothetical protein
MRHVGLALSLSGMMAITPVASAYAAPLTSLSAAAKPLQRASSLQSDVTEVRWRGGWELEPGSSQERSSARHLQRPITMIPTLPDVGSSFEWNQRSCAGFS